MTIEEQFFKTFGIAPIAMKYECKCGTSSTKHTVDTCKSQFCDKKYCNQKQTGVFYPQITAERLLELIVITTKYTNWIRTMNNIDDLKRATLEELINNADWTKNQVQKVFEGE